MKRGNTIRHRALAWMLTLAMVVSMAPATAFAEEIEGPAGCTHVHDGSCGYVEAVAEVPCDMGCTDTDGDGVIEHVMDCAYRPAVEGQLCNHVHDESCGGLTAGEPEVQEPSAEESGGEQQPGESGPEEAEPGTIEPEEGEPDQTELSEDLRALQERIHALPTGDEYRAMSEDEQEAVYTLAADIAEEYAELSEEDQAKLDITRMEELFAVMNEDVERYENDTVTFLNSGYPYGKSMNSSTITLVIEVEGDVSSYQWQVADSKDGTYSDISGAIASTYTFTPTSGSWYRCVVDDTASEAVMAVYPGQDGRTWTRPNASWYIGNGFMAYMTNGSMFDVTGLYTKNGTNYMLQTSYSKAWDLFSNSSAIPSTGSMTSASLDALRVAFDVEDDYNLIFEADLADGQQAFSFGCDTQLGNSSTSGSYSDYAALNAMVKNGVLEQVAMIGAATVSGAEDTDPAFVIAPIDPASRFWIGNFSSRKTYAYNTSGGTAYETIDGQNVVTLLEGIDSGMTMSWMNILSGGSVKFRFSVGDVAHTGAVSGKVDYEKEMLTGLEAGVTYSITVGESTYTITANENGEIPLSGTDDEGKAYDFAGKSLRVAKKDSGDAPAEIEVAGRPEAPDKPSDLEDESTPSLDANIEIVELTTTSVTIAPKEGQQYAYSTDGTNWITLTSLDGNGNYVINELTDGSKVYIRTRVPATNERPASQWSELTEIQLKSTVVASATGWSGGYDGTAHSISVNVTSPAAGATITYCSSADGNYNADQPVFTDVGEYTVYYRVTAEGHYPTYGSDTVTIDRKEVALEWGNTELTYNGTVQTPVATAGSLCGEDTCTVTVNGGQNNVGTGYTATATGVSNSNYKLPETGRTTTFSIVPKEIAINWGSTQLTYNGTEQKPTAAPIGVVNGDDCGLTVSGAQTAVGTYTATAALSNANYKIKTGDEQTSFKIHPKTITADMISLDAVDGKYALKNAPITPVVTVKDGSNTLVHGETGDYILSGDAEKTAYGTYTITVTGKGNYTGSQNVSWYITETNAPTGEITIKDNKWSSFLNNVTLGHFFKNTQTVTVTAQDGENESGVEQVSYYVSQTSYTSSSALGDVSWTVIRNGGSFSIDPKTKAYVYAKIIDNAGNIAYISTNGIVVYTDSVQDTDKITFTRTGTEDVTANVTLNGNVISKIKNAEKELIKGSDYIISADGATITFKAAYLQSLAAGDYTLTVSYDPMGVTYVALEGNEQPTDTTISLSVVKIQESVTDISDVSKIYDGTAVATPVFATANDRGSNDVTIEYKKKGAADSAYTVENPVHAGIYVARITVAGDENYTEASGEKEFTITPKKIGVLWDKKTQFTYNGKVQAPTAALEGVLEGDKCQVTVTGAQKNAGDHTATVVLEGVDASNYSLRDDNTVSFKIYPKKLTSDMVKATTSYCYTGETIVPELTVTDGATVLEAGTDYKLSGAISEKEIGSYTLKLVGIKNYTGTVDVVYKITDSAPPTGTIKVAKNEWKSLINKLTFGIFYKTRQTVTITAADEGSGVEQVSYFLTSNAMLMDQEALAALPDIKWTKIANGGSFAINPDQRYVIYAKITDKSGNVTFISSNGIVLDQTAPVISGIANGKTYCSDVTFTVSDSIGLASVKIDGVDQGIGGSYSIATGSEKATHTIEAADTAGNKTKYTVTINANGGHNFGDWITKAATCTEQGESSRTCSSFGFVEKQIIQKTDHEYATEAHFAWMTKIDEDGFVTGYTAKAYFVCNNDPSHTKDLDSCTVVREEKMKPTIDADGEVQYTATASYGEKHDYKSTKTVTVKKLTKLEDPQATANSNIYTSTSIAENAPQTAVGEELDATLAKDLMTPEEKADYQNENVATDVTLYLEVQNITGAVDEEEKDKVDTQIDDIITAKTNTDAQVKVEKGITYLDLSMYKNVTTKKEDVETSNTTTQITDTETDITITMVLPEEFPLVKEGFSRTYNVIRVHGNEAQLLPCRKDGNNLTFKTSKFSTYAISYVDVKETPVPSSSGGGSVVIPATKITIASDSDKTTLTKTGETLQLTFEITQANATDKKVTWSSSDPKVATVDENGKVMAVGDGTVTITAKTGNGKTATFTITVKIEPEQEADKDDDAGSTGGSSGKITLDTSFRKLALRVPTTTKTTTVLKWNKVADADGYVIYGNKCNSNGKTYQMVKQVVINDNATTTWTDKALTSGTYYKYYIKAYKLVNGKKVWLAKSKVVHSATVGGKYGNAKSLKVNKTAVSLSKGKTFTIAAEQTVKNLPIQKHANIKYESSNSKIASVTSKGVIKAKKKGTCYIYVYAQNGMYKRVKVTVK